MQNIELKPGEKIFIERVIKHPEAKEALKAGKEKTKEFLHERIEELKKEISEIPFIKKEQELHKEEPVNLDLLAEAVNLSLEKDIESGLRFIMEKGDPHLVDLYHDTLVAHFLDKLISLGKVKLEEPKEGGGGQKILTILGILLILALLALLVFWQISNL